MQHDSTDLDSSKELSETTYKYLEFSEAGITWKAPARQKEETVNIDEESSGDELPDPTNPNLAQIVEAQGTSDNQSTSETARKRKYSDETLKKWGKNKKLKIEEQLILTNEREEQKKLRNQIKVLNDELKERVDEFRVFRYFQNRKKSNEKLLKKRKKGKKT